MTSRPTLRQTILSLFAAALIGASSAADAAPDLTGTWEGKVTCKALTNGAVAKPKGNVTLTVTQTGDDVIAAIAPVGLPVRSYFGRVAELTGKAGQGATSLVACSTQAGGTALSEVLSATVKVKPADPLKATLKGTSTYQHVADGTVGGTCKYSFKRTQLAEPSVTPCSFDAVCGNGTVETSEACEVGNLRGATCGGQPGFTGGTLACHAGCTFDTTGCFAVVDPAATSHTFVVSAIDVPTSGSEALALGFDVDGKPSDGVDNQLGAVLASLGALLPSLDFQQLIDGQVDQGLTVLLVDVATTDLADGGGSGVSLYAGTTVMTPPACLDPSDVVCRQQFSGTGAFNVDPLSPTDAALLGTTQSSQFVGRAATLPLRLTLAGTTLAVPLHAAQVQLAGLDASGWSGSGSKIGGAIAQDDVTTSVIPWIGQLVRSSFDETCDVGGTPPSCGCVGGSTGATLRNLFDKPPTQDCVISDAEVSSVMAAFLTPDIDLSGDGTNDALSIGIGVTAVAGTFTVPVP